MKKIAFVLAAALGTLTFACSSETTSASADAEVVAGSSAAPACDPSVLEAAKPRYEKALELSKQRLQGFNCENDAYLHTIETELALAVSVCEGYHDVIKSSAEAEPIRKVLATSLTLRHLTGDLTVGHDWAGLEAALPGTTLYGPAPGVYGNISKLTFLDRDTVKVATLEIDPEPAWTETEARYEIVREGDLVKLRITTPTGGAPSVSVFDTYGIGESDAAEIILLPEGSATLPEAYWTTPAECDA